MPRPAKRKAPPPWALAVLALPLLVTFAFLIFRPDPKRNPAASTAAPPPATPPTPVAPPTPTPPPAAAAPAAPGGAYDPTALLEQGRNAAEVYLAEPRNDSWADPVEAVIGGRLRSDVERLVPGAGVVLKCRRLSCLVGIDAPEDKRQAATAVSKLVTLAPVTVDIAPEEDGTLRWLFFSEPRMADPTFFTEWYLRIRKKTLADIKAGTKPNPLPVPADQLPDE